VYARDRAVPVGDVSRLAFTELLLLAFPVGVLVVALDAVRMDAGVMCVGNVVEVALTEGRRVKAVGVGVDATAKVGRPTDKAGTVLVVRRGGGAVT